jgi:hypothetical protein
MQSPQVHAILLPRIQLICFLRMSLLFDHNSSYLLVFLLYNILL